MILSIHLTNFRQHTDLMIEFGPGINALRGANEAGKSTIIEGIAYAFGGANMLRESLDETVTWGQKATTLKVQVMFEAKGRTMSLMRGKSGAEIRDGKEVLCTGQKEVTKFCEDLLGADMKTLKNLMLANQSALQGVLADKDGPSVAVKLIEVLSNFDLIDDLINLAQTDLPYGDTKPMEQQVISLREQLEGIEVQDLEELQHKMERAQEAEQGASAALVFAKEEWNEVQAAAHAADKLLKEIEESTKAAARLEQEVQTTERVRSEIKPRPAPSDEEIEAMAKKIADAAQLNLATEAANELGITIEDQYDNTDFWDGDESSLVEQIDSVQKNVSIQKDNIQNEKIKKTQLEGRLIKETTCAFCDKDLTDVPEVVQRNSSLMAQIDTCTATIQTHTELLEGSQQELAQLQTVLKIGRTWDKVMARWSQFCRPIDGTFPRKVEWTSTLDLTQDVDPAKLRADLQRAKIQRDEAIADNARLVQLGETLVRQRKALAETEAKLLTLQEGEQEANAALAASAEKLGEMGQAEGDWRDADAALKEAQAAYRQAKAVQDQQKQFQASLEKRVEEAQASVKAMTLNNAFLKKIRGARPAISDKLWNLALAAVSTYFSQGRGEQSVVTRSDNGFLVNGRAIAGLSGSTLDVLGLSIRIALTKIFLPASPWLILDEPASATDTDREINMLGLIQAAQMPQVILISHREIVESYADKVITV